MEPYVNRIQTKISPYLETACSNYAATKLSPARHKDLLLALQPYYSQRFGTARQSFVRAAAGLAMVVAVSSAKNQARSGKHLPAAASSCVDPQTAQRTHVSSTHTRTFTGTHLKPSRIVRLCNITLRTAASRRISAHPRPPTRQIARPLRHFFPNLLHGSVEY